MADSLLTLADLQKINDMNVADVDISDILDYAPLFRSLAAGESSNGTQHKYLKETTAPTVGFRAINDGRDHSKSGDTLVTIDLKILDASFHVDKQGAESDGRGVDYIMQREARRHLKAAFKQAELQMINGTDNDADGFTGLVDASTINHSDDAMVHDAGGTTDLTSVYFFITNNDETDVQLITNGNIEMGEYFEQFAAGATGHYPALWMEIAGWLGLQIGSAVSVGRIANIDAGSNTVDDDLLSHGLELFPEDRQPNLIVMNKRSLGQLQRSRTATNATGAPAPRPTEYEGIPIISTASVLNTETQLVAA